MERSLIKTLHSGDPDVVVLRTMKNALSYSDYILVKFMCHAISHKQICNTDEHKHWGIGM
jgi:hypothetical protein